MWKTWVVLNWRAPFLYCFVSNRANPKGRLQNNTAFGRPQRSVQTRTALHLGLQSVGYVQQVVFLKDTSLGMSKGSKRDTKPPKSIQLQSLPSCDGF